MPQSEGLRRHELSWDGLLRLTPLLRRPSCRGRLLERPRPSHHLTCCRHRHQPRSRLLPFCPWGHPSPPMLRWLRRRYPRPAPLVEEVLDAPTARGVDALEEGAQNRDPSWGAATSSSRGEVPMNGVGRGSSSGPVVPRNPSLFLTMSERSRLGMSFVSVPRQWWGRFGRP
jgi:hypothetical protein